MDLGATGTVIEQQVQSSSNRYSHRATGTVIEQQVQSSRNRYSHRATGTVIEQQVQSSSNRYSHRATGTVIEQQVQSSSNRYKSSTPTYRLNHQHPLPPPAPHATLLRSGGSPGNQPGGEVENPHSHLPSLRMQPRHKLKMSIPSHKRQFMRYSRCSNPYIIFGNRPALI